MKALSLFSGIGGIDLAAEWAGIETVAFCEREPFCQKVLAKHWPKTPIYDDVCTLTKERLEEDGIDTKTIGLVYGGYPCQPFSLAGERKGEGDDRHLWPEVARLLAQIRPRWFVGENVAGHITLGLDDVLSELGNIGYTVQPFIIPACAVNAPHRRERVFIVACITDSNNTYTLGEVQRRESAHAGRVCKDVDNTYGKGMERSEDSGITESSREERNEQFIGCSEGGGNWATEPRVGRVAHGIPQRVDRLKSLGNAVVPQQIYPILAAIKQIDDMLQAV